MPVSSGLPEHWTCVTPAVTGLDVLPADPGHLPASLRGGVTADLFPQLSGKRICSFKDTQPHQRKQAGAP